LNLMRLNILFLILSIFAIAHVSVAEVPIFDLAEEALKAKTLELEAWEPSLKFIQELRKIYIEVIKVREQVADSPTELIEILDLFENVDIKPVCNSCLTFVGAIRKVASRGFVQKLIEKVADYACRTKMSKTVCAEAIQSYGDLVFDTLLDRTVDPQRVCQKLAMCPHTRERTRLKDYVKEVLKDKPETNRPKPTHKGTYTVLQLSDPHVDLLYAEGASHTCDQPLCCRPEFGYPSNASEGAQHWGTVGPCDIPFRTFSQFLQYTSSNFDIDMIIWTGDNIAHDIWHQSQANQTLSTHEITKEIFKYFPDTPVYPMFGNHEPYPSDQYDTLGNTSSWLIDELSDMWKPWLDEKALETFKNYSYYSMVNKEQNVKVIAMDTQACDTEDFFLIRDPSDPMHELEWLRKELYESEAANQGVFILGHIPPGDSVCYDQWSSRYRALIDRFTNTVRGQFFGHTHHDHFQVIRSFADNSPVGVAIIAPAFTTFSYLKPSFRIIEVDSETNVPVDFHQYRLDLDKYNNNPALTTLEWDLAYSFVEQYGLKDMSFDSFDKLADQIKSDKDVARLFQFNHDSGAHSQGYLNARATQKAYCQAKFSVYEDVLKCLGLHAKSSDVFKFAKQFLPGKWYSDKC
jgi:sphingomyelin phosphodiesterase